MLQPQNLFDTASAVIVVGGTSLATVLRCGLWDTRMAVSAGAGLFRPRFSAVRARAELAVQVRQMQQRGVIGAASHHFGDVALDDATDALIGARSIAALREAHQAHKRRRVEQSQRAVRTFSQAADLAPVFGLAGTLISLSQLPTGPNVGGGFTAAISMAVLTTLYGLLLGNLVISPLGRSVARRAAQEEKERQRVLEWLEAQVADALPRVSAHAPVLHAAGGKSR